MRRFRVDIFEQLVETLNSLPSIGKKSAIKLAYYLSVEDKFKALKLIEALESAVSGVRECIRCNGISSDELCPICSDNLRDRSKLCIVQSPKDIFTIEETGSYDGLYYVLDSIEKLNQSHLESVVDSGVAEIIFAFPPSIANDTLILYIEDKLRGRDLRFSKIAQGVPSGIELDSVDTLSLSKALQDRVKV
jgi:recombination protein RecR